MTEYNDTTDENGDVSIELPEGEYRITITADGYESVTENVAVDAGETVVQESSLEVLGGTGLPDGYGRITGTVSDENGEPVGYVDRVHVAIDGTMCLVDGSGEFDRLVEAGEYTVRVHGDDFVTHTENSVTVESGETVELDISLEHDVVEYDPVEDEWLYDGYVHPPSSRIREGPIEGEFRQQLFVGQTDREVLTDVKRFTFDIVAVFTGLEAYHGNFDDEDDTFGMLHDFALSIDGGNATHVDYRDIDSHLVRGWRVPTEEEVYENTDLGPEDIHDEDKISQELQEAHDLDLSTASMIVGAAGIALTTTKLGLPLGVVSLGLSVGNSLLDGDESAGEYEWALEPNEYEDPRNGMAMAHLGRQVVDVERQMGTIGELEVETTFTTSSMPGCEPDQDDTDVYEELHSVPNPTLSKEVQLL